MLRDPGIKGSHNLIIDQQDIIVCDTMGHSVKIFDRASSELRRRIHLPDIPQVTRIKRRSEASPLMKNIGKLKHTPLKKAYYKMRLDKAVPALPLFVRGSDAVDDFLFVGFSPATVVMVHRHTGELIDIHQFSNDVFACVHGLRVVH